MPQALKSHQQEGEFAQERLNQIRLYKDRARYDYDTVHSIIDATFVSHVSFVQEYEGQPIPINMPLTMVLGHYNPLCRYADHDDEYLRKTQQDAMQNTPMEAYLHGNAASMLHRAIRESKNGSVSVCISSTIGRGEISQSCVLNLAKKNGNAVDGVVLFLTPNGHSLNYRSATVHGEAILVPDAELDKKMWAMRLLTNHMSKGRWEATYPVFAKAMEHVQVIEVKIRCASAKIRAANVGGFDLNKVLDHNPHWKSKNVWSGVVPLYEVLGRGISSEIMGPLGETTEALQQVDSWRRERNQLSKDYAETVATVGTVEQDLKIKLEQLLEKNG